MSYLSEKNFKKQLLEAQRDNLSKERKLKLRKEKEKYASKIKLPSTSKLVLFGVILLCLQIVLFCEYAMYISGDTSAMYVLIGIPATLIPVVWAYYSKAKAENTVGGITYDMAMVEINQQNTSMNSEDTNSEEAIG